MTDAVHEQALLARLGFRAPERTIRELPDGWADDERWRALLATVGETAADPDAAVRRLGRVGAAERLLADPSSGKGLIAAVGFSEHLATLMLHTGKDLRSVKDRRLLEIAMQDLVEPPTRTSFERAAGALAELADDCLTQALGDRADGFAIMAMGKYGGRELNYASDIDVLFVYRDADHDEAERIARDVMAVMNGPPPVFRTDADLRPEGKDGPLVRSLEAYEAYYRRWAQAWEFQALIKCRFAAGDAGLGAAFLDLVRPFVWPEQLAPEAIEQIRVLKGRVEREVERLGLTGRQVKLGPGGIRDAEFAVQLLQLVHARHRPELRSPNTLAALDALGAEGFVAETDAERLAEAYVFLRHAEHRLQLVGGRQTHTLPSKPADREHLARGLGYRDSADGGALEAFERDWLQTTTVVRQIHERLFYRPLLEAFASAPNVGPTLGVDEARDRLAVLGFDMPPRAQEAIAELTAGSARRAKVMRAILPGLLSWLSETPDPDAGLGRLKDLVPQLDALPHLLALLRDSPPVAELLCRALGTGPAIAELLQREPGLVADLRPDEPEDRAAVIREAVAIVSRASSAHGTTALRRFKDAGWLRGAVRDLAAGDRPSVFVEVGTALSDLGDACLEGALRMARAESDAQTGGPPPGGFAVVAMGRFGGRELNHASDLDVMFVYERDGTCPDGSEGRLYHAAVAERVAAILGSVPPIFRVDAEIRPEGRSGPIVRSLESFEQYYDRWADTWEFQALTRARHAAGDEALTARLLDAVRDRVFPPKLRAEQVSQIRHMKARIERERVKSTQDPRYHVKLGTGGLADVEFTVQLLQMRHGHAIEGARSANTLQALDALRRARMVGERDAVWLRDAYLMLNRVRNHLFLLRGLPTDVIPRRDEDQERLARSLGYGRPSRSRFLEDYRRATRRARQVCDRLFYGEDG